MSQAIYSSSQSKLDTIESVVTLMAPVVDWLLSNGIGHAEFAQALKTVFYQRAREAALQQKLKPTDSTLSLLSGLHRRDISTIKQNLDSGETVSPLPPRISTPEQVISLWLNDSWPTTIPFSKSERSFEQLVFQISRDKHPRSILTELERLGLVKEENQQVTLLKDSFIPKPNSREMKNLLATCVADHVAAGLHNLNTSGGGTFLEQSVAADELTEQSAQILIEYSSRLWTLTADLVLAKATVLSQLDQNAPDNDYRFRFGVFNYANPAPTEFASAQVNLQSLREPSDPDQTLEEIWATHARGDSNDPS